MSYDKYTQEQQEAIKAMQLFTGIEIQSYKLMGVIYRGIWLPSLEVHKHTIVSLIKRKVVEFKDGKYRLTSKGYTLQFELYTGAHSKGAW